MLSRQNDCIGAWRKCVRDLGRNLLYSHIYFLQRGRIQPSVLETGYLKIEEDSLITCAALSPDGTTVAAACADGLVRFYQIYLFDVRNHRCLHEWKPHDGKAVNSLFFLDNINKPVEE